MSFVPPVRPRLSRLPFADPEMTWQKFEDFCLDYVSRRDDVQSARFYGTAGSTQKGIDIIADMKNGEKWAFQCRHWKKITATNVKNTVKKATYVAAHYVIMLTSDATTEARDECDLHPKWELWDGRDLSQKVRELELDQARILLDTNFGPLVRREFIGLDSLVAFRSASAYFQNFLSAGASFNHNWTLVGRVKELQSLRDFVSSSQLVCVLPGKGGAGKTKLLHAFSEEFSSHFPDAELRFMAEGTPLSASVLDELPLRPCVVVVDDAHRIGDLKPLLELAGQRATQAAQAAQAATPVPYIKVILLCRPFARDAMRSQAQNFVGSSRVSVMDELGRLSHQDVEILAAQALGPGLEVHATALARLTRDCPLVTTVGGRLLASGSVGLGLLEQSEEFRAVVLDRFREEIVGRIEGCDPPFAARLLDLISAVAPVRLDDPNFIKAMADFLSVSVADVIRALDALESGGVLSRRGDKLRITPDVLSDHILHQACLTKSGQSTTYGESVLNSFLGICLNQVVRNLAELDWRFRTAQGSETRVLDTFWRQWNAEYQTAAPSVKSAMLDFMKNLAPSQPQQVLALVETTAQDAANSDIFYKLPPILRIVAYHPRFTARCLDLLWILGRDDGRQQNQLPDHPMRVLKELAAYDIQMGVPSHLNRAAIASCEKWLQQNDAHDHLHSPLDVADTLLAKTAISDFSYGFQVVNKAFVVAPKATASLRARATKCVRKCIQSGQEKAVERAIESCRNMTSSPIEYFNMSLSLEQLSIWIPEQEHGFELLAEAVPKLSTPFGVLKASRHLGWHLEFNPHQELREKARQMFLNLPNSFELRLIQCLSWHDSADYARAFLHLSQSEELEAGESGEESHSKKRQEIQYKIEEERSKHCLDEFLTLYSDPEQGMEILRFYVEEAERRGLRAGWNGASRFAFDLAKASHNYAVFVAETVLCNAQSSLAHICSTMLMPLRVVDSTRALDLVRHLSESPEEIHQRIAAGVYGNNSWRDDLNSDDWPIIEALSQSPFWSVRSVLLSALRWIQAESKPLSPQVFSRVLEILFGMEISGNAEVADDWAEFFAGYYPTFPLADLSDQQCQAFLERLEGVEDIDHHSVKAALVVLSERMPTDVVRWLLRRFDQANSGFKPVPYTHFQDEGHGPSYDLKGLADSPNYLDLLREIRAHALGARGRKALFLPSLFQMASLDYNPHSLQVLDEWIDEAQCENDGAKLRAVGVLLSEAPRGFAYAQVPFVTRLLSVAEAIGDDVLQTVKADIYSSMTSGIIMSSPLEPAPIHVHQRDECRKIAQNLTLGSVEREFYESMALSAECMIADDLKRDEELDDDD